MIILASTSTTRQQMLRQAGINFTVMAASLDEETEKANLGPRTAKSMAQALALAKARSVSAAHASAIVIGADQTLECAGHMYSKPKNNTEARQQLSLLKGKQHALYSAVTVTKADSVIFQTTTTAQLTMRNFSDGFLNSYLEKLGPDQCGSPGCYHVESIGIQLFERIEGDYFTILGLPLLPLLAFLREIGELQT